MKCCESDGVIISQLGGVSDNLGHPERVSDNQVNQEVSDNPGQPGRASDNPGQPESQ